MKKLLLTFNIALVICALHAQCGAAFTWSQSQPNVIDFVDATSPQPPFPAGTYYYWDFGDNNNDGSWGPAPMSHTYGMPGTYYVCVTQTDSNSMYFCTFCDSVTVTGTLLCNLTIDYITGYASQCSTCGNGAASVSCSQGTPPYTYQWSSGDSTAWAFGLSGGTYTCCITDANGCVVCDSVVVPAGPPANCSVSFGWNTANGGQVIFGAYAPNLFGPATYTWNFGDMSTGTGQSPWHQYAQSGTYNVCATVYDSVSQCSDSTCHSVVVNVTNPSCMAAFYIEMDTVTPNLAWVYNLSTGSPSMQYDWWWGDNTPNDTVPYPTHVYQQNGTYMICLVVIDQANQCTDTLCQYINVARFAQQAMQSPLYVNVIPPASSGVSETNGMGGWVLQPNPSSDVIHLEGNIGNKDQFIITDVSGRTVKRGTANNSSIDISMLNSGSYFFTLIRETGAAETQQFIRE